MPTETPLNQIRRFLTWATRKIDIHFGERPEFYFYEREVWWASLGENIGSLNHAFIQLIKTNPPT